MSNEVVNKDVLSAHAAGNGIKEDTTPEDVASNVFKTGLPKFKTLTSEMSKNQLHRVMNALTEAPLNSKKFIFYDNKEIEGFNLGLKLMEAKFIMFQAVYNERLANQVANENNEKKEKNNEALVS